MYHGTTTGNMGINWYPNGYPVTPQRICPGCGRCPVCGRQDAQPQYPVYPWTPSDIPSNPWSEPTITWS